MDLTHIGKTCEGQRLHGNRQRTAPWNRWGTFLSERAWGTVLSVCRHQGAKLIPRDFILLKGK
jgi:hypothetical protein